MFNRDRQYLISGLLLKKTIVAIKRFIELNSEYNDTMTDLILQLLMLDEIREFRQRDMLDPTTFMPELTDEEINEMVQDLEDDLMDIRDSFSSKHPKSDSSKSLDDICKDLGLTLPDDKNGQSPKK